MKILKSPNLPKLKSAKYKCPDCNSKVLSEDKELLNQVKLGMDGKVYVSTIKFQRCPFCGAPIETKKVQLSRVRRYYLIKYNNDRLYGYTWMMNDPNAPEIQWDLTSLGNTEKEDINSK